ncbi:hypothetical protein IWW38_005822 [Coemansia aciculifera]|uniref:Uncharacterized protein n=1 Tax=Coemansia aciculifera TaxID=417176 RepID=A0ACC1LU00_9FUNG|nr:hypothetical protein IWW38_005822 [Coemansia aciculifera]
MASDVDEDDSWLALDPDELDDMMRKADSILKDSAQDDPDQRMSEDSDQGTEDGAAVTDLQQVLEKFESFLAGDSGLEGAEILKYVSV